MKFNLQYIFISLLFHSFIFIEIEEPKKIVSENKDKVAIKLHHKKEEKPLSKKEQNNISYEFINKGLAKGIGAEDNSSSTGSKCHKKDIYGGVGLMVENTKVNRNFIANLIVSVVGKGYPAEKAGIIKGDRLVRILADSDNDERSGFLPFPVYLKGKAGTELTLLIERDGNLITKVLKRDEICAVKKKKIN